MKQLSSTKVGLMAISAALAGVAALQLMGNQQVVSDAPPTTDSSDKLLTVTTSMYPLTYFATAIGGEYVQVTTLTPNGIEPHEYEPTAQDIAQLEHSDLIILNGGGMESWSADVQANVPSTTQMITTGTQVMDQAMIEEGVSIVDPHVWLSPKRAQAQVTVIAEAFKNTDPEHANEYQSNAEALIQQLEQLSQDYQTGLSRCKQHDIITTHAAFGYMAHDYGLKQIPINGLSPEAEPTQTDLADIAAFAKKNKVGYIFFETLVSPELATTIADEIGAQTLVLNPLEGLTEDEQRAEADYLTIMHTNLTNLQTALQCQ